MSYHKRHLLFRHQGPTAEIARLDPVTDCQRIVHLLAAYEYAWDLDRALELALFHTYGSQSVSRLLDRTGEFAQRGQQRYDDTTLLIRAFMEAGWDSDFGQRALSRMNEIHGCFAIPNDDYLFVLWTFIDFPIRWAARFAWRPFTAHEELAWFTFWHSVGERMGMHSIPATKTDYDVFVERYERAQFLPNEASQRVAAATIGIMQGWLPRPLQGVVQPAARALISDRLREVFNYAPAPALLGKGLETALKLRGRITRHIPLSAYPSTLATHTTRTYGATPARIDSIGRPVRRLELA